MIEIKNRFNGSVLKRIAAIHLRGADLRGADLRDADLRGADLRDADLSDADGVTAPIVPNIDSAILEAIAAASGTGYGGLNMSLWHTCGTMHCRAGWAIHLAGPAGYALEKQLGPCAAGALIYHASRPGTRVPNFYDSSENTMIDLRKHASGQS